MIFKNILIEINDKDFSFKNPVKLTYNHMPTRVIGRATLTLKEDGLYADLDITQYKFHKGTFYPSIGYVKKGKKRGRITCVSMCNSNEDKRIKPIIIE